MKRARILLVDDTATDTKLFEVAARKAKWIREVKISADGQQALELLRSDGPSGYLPHLILIDLNMPRMSGFELLDELKKDDKLRRIPTIVLTTSGAQRDMKEAYNRLANSFITKPADYPGLVKMVDSLESFWLEIATIPTKL